MVKLITQLNQADNALIEVGAPRFTKVSPGALIDRSVWQLAQMLLDEGER